MPHRMHEGPESAGNDEEQVALTADDYLTGERITPHRLTPDMSVADLLDSSFQAYNAGRINEAARLYAQRMLDPERDVTICTVLPATIQSPAQAC